MKKLILLLLMAAGLFAQSESGGYYIPSKWKLSGTIISPSLSTWSVSLPVTTATSLAVAQFRVAHPSYATHSANIDNDGGIYSFDALGTGTYYNWKINSATKMTLDMNGNVGIGTTAPGATLDVNGGSGLGLQVKGGDTGVGTTILNVIKSDATSAFHVLGDGTIGAKNALQVGTNYYANVAPANGAIIEGNVGIGTTTFGTSAARVFGLGNGTAPTSSPADMIQLWAEDVATSSELRVRDEAGNITTLSPHAKDAPEWMYDLGIGIDEMHRIANMYTGEITFVNETRKNTLTQMVINGEVIPAGNARLFKVTETFEEYNLRTGANLQKENWDENQQNIYDIRAREIADYDIKKAEFEAKKLEYSNMTEEEKESKGALEEFKKERPIEYVKKVSPIHIKK